MRNLQAFAAIAVLFTVFSAPALAQRQQPAIEGDQAVQIVQSGKIRAAKTDGVAGFVLLMEFQGKSYVCTLAATGQVQTCNQIYW